MQATQAKEHEKRPPMTGAQYLDSLRDGREIWLNGERVLDVTTHLGFRNGTRSVARLYDALHDPTQQEVLTGITPNQGQWILPHGAGPAESFVIRGYAFRDEARISYRPVHFTGRS
jgi:4-hydroxyphenylacetate 3-monooxygenase